MLEHNPSWNTDDEEDQRAFLPANDCRRFNGGLVATPEIQALWFLGVDEKTITDDVLPVNLVLAIDRLRL